MKKINSIYKSELIEGLVKINLDCFYDERGEIWTVFAKEFVPHDFVEDKVSISHKNVLRGFHGDADTVKLVSCLHGEFQFSVVDLRKDSQTFQNCESFIITDAEPSVILVPAGCLNAHLCLSDKCVFYYKWSKPYAGPGNQVTVAWDDPDINMSWLINDPVMSDRDQKGVKLKGVLF